jgi:methylenetetrahydrofolate--tRNA-(uracil-5-)-methyltransferase
MESAATGILAGINAARILKGLAPVALPPESMLGSLVNFITVNSQNFQPMNANFGILPALTDSPRDKKIRYERYVQRAVEAVSKFSELFIDRL